MLKRPRFAGNAILILFALVLAVRSLVPAGWMPSEDKAFAINVCTGFQTQTVWVDRSGTIHQSDPSKKDHKEESQDSCAFAGLGIPMLPAVAEHRIASGPFHNSELPIATSPVSIGKGLAAPPPPSTGPPFLT